MTYRFNPPPNWPAPPPGWTMPAGWQPDPSWGPLPPGWVLWIPEQVTPAPAPIPSPASAPAPVPVPAQASGPASEPLLVPAWCDPRMRNVLWDAGTILAGVFMVDDTGVGYATTDGLLFAAPLSDVRLKWPKRYRLVRGCDLSLGQQGFRLYFARPMDGAPRIREDQTTRITDALTSEYSDLIQLVGGSLGRVAQVGTLVATLVSIPGEFSDQRRGQAHGDTVRRRLQAYEAR